MTLQALRDGGKRALASALAALERDPENAATQTLLDAAWRQPRAHRKAGGCAGGAQGKSGLTDLRLDLE